MHGFLKIGHRFEGGAVAALWAIKPYSTVGAQTEYRALDAVWYGV